MKTRLELQYDVALNALSNGLTEAGITVGDINTLRVKGQRLVETNRNQYNSVFGMLENLVAQRINEEQAPATAPASPAAASKEQQAFAAKSTQLQTAIRNYFASIFKLGGGPSVQEQMKKMIGTVNSFTNQVLQKKFGVGGKPAVDPMAAKMAQSSAKPPAGKPQGTPAPAGTPAKPASGQPQYNPLATQSVATTDIKAGQQQAAQPQYNPFAAQSVIA